MRKQFNFLKYNIKNNFWHDIFKIIGIIFIIIIFTIVISELGYQNYIRKRCLNFENTVFVSYDKSHPFFENYKKTGWIFEGDNTVQNSCQEAIIANDFIFNAYELPLAKGRMPKLEGEAIVPWQLCDKFKIGQTYKLENGYKFTITGYLIQDYFISIQYPYTTSFPLGYDIAILSNDENLWKSESEIYDSWYCNYEIPENIRNEIKQNEKLQEEINCYGITLKEKGEKFLKETKHGNFGMSVLFLFGTSLILVFLLADNILKTKINKLNLGLSYLFGQSKKNIILLQLFKNLIIIALAILLSYIKFINSFSEKGFLMTWKSWGISIGIVGGVLIIMAIIDYIKLRKTDFSEILNYRE